MSVKVSVYVWGAITKRIFKTWQDKLPKKIPDIITVSQDFLPDANYIVVEIDCKVEGFNKWSHNSRILDSTKLVTSDWVVACLKAAKLVPAFPFLVKFEPKDQSKDHQILDDAEEHFPAKQIASQNSDISDNEYVLTEDDSGNLSSDEIILNNENRHITDILDQIQQIYRLCGDEWRALSYRKCIATLKQLPAIHNKEQLYHIPTVGKSMADHIIEILETGTLKKLDFMKKDPRIQSITELSNIWGVGDKTAEKWYKQGYHSVADLRKKGMHLLNAQQLVGLTYYEDFLVKIPRHEVDEIYSIVDQECKKIEPHAELIVGGSYRRGKSLCGDVDMLMFPSIASGMDALPESTLTKLILALEQKGFLTDHLVLPAEYYQHHSSQSGGSEQKQIKETRKRDRQHSQLNSIPYYFKSADTTDNRNNSNNTEGTLAAINSELHNPTDMIGENSLLDKQQVHERKPSTATSQRSTTTTHSSLSTHPTTNSTDVNASKESVSSVAIATPTKPRLRQQEESQHHHILEVESDHRSTYMGVCKLITADNSDIAQHIEPVVEGKSVEKSEVIEHLHRRIDIKLYPRHCFSYALLYFTGPDYFNRAMRRYAEQHGYHLSDKHLLRLGNNYNSSIITCSDSSPSYGYVDCHTEEDIFAELGLQYQEPWERNRLIELTPSHC